MRSLRDYIQEALKINRSSKIVTGDLDVGQFNLESQERHNDEEFRYIFSFQGNNIRLIKIRPEYSSFVGNVLYRDEYNPDMVLSAIEIGRRGYEYNLQYIERSKNKKKNIIFPDLNMFKDRYIKSLEEFNITEDILDWKLLYSYIKKAKIMYRFPLRLDILKSFRYKSSLVYQII